MAAVALVAPPPSAAAVREAEPIDWDAVNRIRYEGLSRSRVEQTLLHLTDVIGPRLTGSPGLAEANAWTRDRLEEWGMERARLEPWGRFGLGWSFDRTTVHMLSPRSTPLSALPLAWTPGTGGAVQGEAMQVEIARESDLEAYRGKIEGKILLMDAGRDLEPRPEPDFERYTAEELEELTEYPIPGEPRAERYRRRWIERYRLRKALNRFLAEQGVLATVEISSRDAGILRVGAGGSREPGESPGVTGLVMAAEHYNWIVRLVERGVPVKLELDVSARFHDEDLQGYNTIAEIPGSDLADELVMVGAHLDSWHAAAGSNDNAAGCAVVMEAVRILEAIGVRPRRTIRVALWTGEEQGLLGSRAYVERHFASRPPPDDPEARQLPRSLWPPTWPLELRADHRDFSVYFNLDNGSGRIRGVYTQGNVAVGPIFERWLEPFRDLGADTVTHRDTSGTDHLPFDRVGLPAFQFIQDDLDYTSRTHHTDLDHFDHAVVDDLKQASVVLASFLYHAAMRDQKLPREPLPQAPPPIDEKQDRPRGDAPSTTAR